MAHKHYIVYVKGPGIPRARPMGESGPVLNRIHAIMFNTEQEALSDRDSLAKANTQHTFTIRATN
jgi:hypothetical protein